MQDHALSCKFIGLWPSEKSLINWIQNKWNLNGQIDMELGENGFFTLNFSNLEDRMRVFKGDLYIFSNVELFIEFWKE